MQSFLGGFKSNGGETYKYQLGTKRQMKLSSSFVNLYYNFFFTLLWFPWLSYTYPYRFTRSLLGRLFGWSFHLLNV